MPSSLNETFDPSACTAEHAEMNKSSDAMTLRRPEKPLAVQRRKRLAVGVSPRNVAALGAKLRSGDTHNSRLGRLKRQRTSSLTRVIAALSLAHTPAAPSFARNSFIDFPPKAFTG